MNLKVMSMATASLITVLALTGCSHPGTEIKEAGGFIGYLFEKMDTNSDGFVDEKEYMTSIEERFERFDDSGDNNITLAEFQESRFVEMVPSFANNLFKGYDANEDKIVTKDEVLTKEKRSFKEITQAHEDKFTKNEFVLFMKKERFEALDINDDGVIVLEEYQASKSPFEK